MTQSPVTKAIREEAKSARMKLYLATRTIDEILTSKPEDAADKLKPFIEAAKRLPSR